MGGQLHRHQRLNVHEGDPHVEIALNHQKCAVPARLVSLPKKEVDVVSAIPALASVFGMEHVDSGKQF